MANPASTRQPVTGGMGGGVLAEKWGRVLVSCGLPCKLWVLDRLDFFFAHRETIDKHVIGM